MRAVICCLLIAGILLPSVATSGVLTVTNERSSTGPSRAAMAAVATGGDDIGWLLKFALGYTLGKLVDWYVELQSQPGFYEPPDPPGSWWPGRI